MENSRNQHNQFAVTKEDYKKTTHLDVECTKTKSTTDRRFGDCIIMKNNKTGRSIVVKERISNSSKEADRDILQAKKRMTLQHNGLQRMLDWSCSLKSGLCSKNYVVKTYYEEPANDLRAEMQQMAKEGRRFSHEQLTHIAYQLLDGTCYLHKRGCSADDIRPVYVGVKHESYGYELVDRLADASPAQQCQINHFINGHNLYMSPALYEGAGKIGGKNGIISHDPQKSDAWSIGLVLLECGLLESVQDIYNKSTHSINEDRLQHHLDTFRRHYGNDNGLVCDMTQHLLYIDEGRRYNCCDVLAQIPPYNEISSHFNSSRVSLDSPRKEVIVQRPPTVVYNSSPQKVIETSNLRRSYRNEVYHAPQNLHTSNVRQSYRVQQEPVRQSYRVQQEPVRVVQQPHRVQQEPVRVVQQSHMVHQEPIRVVQQPQTMRSEVITNQAPAMRSNYVRQSVRTPVTNTSAIYGNVTRASNIRQSVRAPTTQFGTNSMAYRQPVVTMSNAPVTMDSGIRQSIRTSGVVGSYPSNYTSPVIGTASNVGNYVTGSRVVSNGEHFGESRVVSQPHVTNYTATGNAMTLHQNSARTHTSGSTFSRNVNIEGNVNPEFVRAAMKQNKEHTGLGDDFRRSIRVVRDPTEVAHYEKKMNIANSGLGHGQVLKEEDESDEDDIPVSHLINSTMPRKF